MEPVLTFRTLPDLRIIGGLIPIVDAASFRKDLVVNHEMTIGVRAVPGARAEIPLARHGSRDAILTDPFRQVHHRGAKLAALDIPIEPIGATGFTTITEQVLIRRGRLCLSPDLNGRRGYIIDRRGEGKGV